MNQTDRPRFAQALEAMATLYGQELNTQLIELWWKLCQDIEIEAFQAALEHHARTQRFMPKPADVLSRIEGTPDSRAIQAWLTVIQAVREHGSWRSVAFTDPLIVPTVKAIGGWQQLCLTSTQDLHWKERAFLERYQLFEQSPPHQAGGYLASNSEAHNKALGHDVPAPIVVDAPGTPLLTDQGTRSPHDAETIAQTAQRLAHSMSAKPGGGG